ncbi:DUF1488 family protein [Bradyrhizobium japonicum]
MIEFPNHSRSYDRTRRAVRFWGHDSAIEASFFIEEEALKRIQPDTCYDEFEPSPRVRFQSGLDMRRRRQGVRSRYQGLLRSRRRQFLSRSAPFKGFAPEPNEPLCLCL